jgi:hypothetical protein
VNYRRPAFGNSVTESAARSRQYQERRYARHEKSTNLSPMPACNGIVAATRWQNHLAPFNVSTVTGLTRLRQIR